MRESRHPDLPARGLRLARSVPRGWRAALGDELRMISAWLSSPMIRGFEWFLQLGLPTAATVLEMQNLKRRIPEIGEIDQTLSFLRQRRAPGAASAATHPRATPFAD